MGLLTFSLYAGFVKLQGRAYLHVIHPAHHPFNYRPSIHSLFSHPTIHPFIHPTIHLSIHPSSNHPTTYPTIHSTIHPPTLYPSVYSIPIHLENLLDFIEEIGGKDCHSPHRARSQGRTTNRSHSVPCRATLRRPGLGPRNLSSLSSWRRPKRKLLWVPGHSLALLPEIRKCHLEI